MLANLEGEDSVTRDNAVWSGFTFLVGFLIVFRTSQSYSRFWDGCTSTHHMRAEWFDGCSSLVAFCRHSKVDKELVGAFQNTLVRLFSMLHASALGEIEDSCNDEFESVEAFKFELIDVEGIDEESLKAVKDSHAKVELIFQWIQQLIVENISTGVLSIPPPILSRSFQEIANGMVAFHDAMKISYIPFPFPYAQTCDFLLLLHWFIGPFVVSQWVTEWWWGFVFSFTQIFILWALNFIAVELENPFGMDANDIDGREMQLEMNEHLLLLMRPSTRRTPQLSAKVQDLSLPDTHCVREQIKHKSFCDVWHHMEDGEVVARRFSVAATKSLPRGSERRSIASRTSRKSARNSRTSNVSGSFERIDSALSNLTLKDDRLSSRQQTPDGDASESVTANRYHLAKPAIPQTRPGIPSSKSGPLSSPRPPGPSGLTEQERSQPKPSSREHTTDDTEPAPLPLPRIVVLEPMTNRDATDPWNPMDDGTKRGGWRSKDQEFERRGWQEDGSAAPWPSQGVPPTATRGSQGPRPGTKNNPINGFSDLGLFDGDGFDVPAPSLPATAGPVASAQLGKDGPSYQPVPRKPIPDNDERSTASGGADEPPPHSL